MKKKANDTGVEIGRNFWWWLYRNWDGYRNRKYYYTMQLMELRDLYSMRLMCLKIRFWELYYAVNVFVWTEIAWINIETTQNFCCLCFVRLTYLGKCLNDDCGVWKMHRNSAWNVIEYLSESRDCRKLSTKSTYI